MGNAPTPSPGAAAGAAVYSRFVLALYDLEVLGFELPFVFGCPARRIVDLYDRHVSARHLDVGVGTGFFLDRCRFPVESPVVHLLDLNRNSLEKTARRIARYRPVSHHANVLEPLPRELPRFESVAATNLLHCLPGAMPAKALVFENLKPFLSPGGVLFGTTVLGRGVDAGPLTRAANRIYNRRSIFSNLEDDAGALEDALSRHFRERKVEVVGSLAFFTARA